jgi:hypothetical protein
MWTKLGMAAILAALLASTADLGSARAADGRATQKARLAVHRRSACSGVKALRNTSVARRQAAKLCYRFGPLTPSARSANLVAGDGTKNGLSRGTAIASRGAFEVGGGRGPSGTALGGGDRSIHTKPSMHETSPGMSGGGASGPSAPATSGSTGATGSGSSAPTNPR